ncbi:MAG: FAD-binding oxidoreductase [Hyphomicrobiales bacterium]|nr:MAG: FAD-binding oxidoreductase [Hyphomicrobiales bacterium]
MIFQRRADVVSWGRVVRVPQTVAMPRFRDEIADAMMSEMPGGLLAIGQRRSYGDSIFNTGGHLIDMRALDRFLAFDRDTGILRAEAGVTLGQIMRLAVPAGYFPAVTPGTRHVTLGGALANDVHGKNHHVAGTFGRHVTRIGLLRSDGYRELSPGDNLFAATIGGLGLTGVILWAEIQLQRIGSSDLDVEITPYDSLEAFWQLAEASTASHEHTVAWIDFAARGRKLGRGIFTRANWRATGSLQTHSEGFRRSVPFEVPFCLLSGPSMRAFNALYYRVQKGKRGPQVQPYADFFHPLDAVADWNRLYGRRGFYQYQCVVPAGSMRDAIAALVGAIVQAGQGSALAVLKTCGAIPSPGLLSFPMEGATLALDFPNRGAETLALMSRLDGIVREAGGRLYAAKDGRIPKETWAAGYPQTATFARFVDPRFASDFWRRVA